MREQVEQLRFSYESSLFNRIERDVGAASVQEGVQRERFQARKRSLLGDAVRITPDLLPKVHALYKSCLQLVGGGLTGDLYIQASNDYNAGVAAHGDHFDLMLHSALVRDFTLDELAFVIGHELGHVIFKHSNFNIHDILRSEEGVTAQTASLLLGWSRAAEVSADRVGMLCCGALMPAVSALFKTSSGLGGVDEQLLLDSFRTQYDDLVSHMESEGEGYEWIRTHPMIPIRFKAIELVALDVSSLRRSPDSFSWSGFRRVDKVISDILKGLDEQSGPGAGGGPGLGGHRHKPLTMVAGKLTAFVMMLYVALSDGPVNFFERVAITDVMMTLKADVPVSTMIDQANSDRASFMRVGLDDLEQYKPRLSREDIHAILMLAASVARETGGNITGQERKALETCARFLGQDEFELGKAIREVEEGNLKPVKIASR